ncbi:MAG: endonuclease III domain-containing protein [Candidatus Omnitrophica bacterium]|nr:endonuclease III domain-containing protein [Candidatus Omnitrophota bacterium]
MKKVLLDIYKRLHNRFGSQNWWPGESQFEVIVGAILTQNTAWSNVEKAIKNLKREGLLSPKTLSKIKTSRLSRLIRPSGYYNIKAKRLRNFIDFLKTRYRGNLSKLFKIETQTLRNALLNIKGVGPETADSILLYAGNKPVFVIDSYTKRIFSRHRLIHKNDTYMQIQDFFMSNLPKNTKLYNEYHALIVKVGKDFCKKKKPKCNICPLNGLGISQFKDKYIA